MPSTTPFPATHGGFPTSSTAVTAIVAVMMTGMNAKTAHALCTNDCEYPEDGDCDDGGPGHDYDSCAYGSDCNDCGERCPLSEIADPVSGLCISCGNAEEPNEPSYDACIPCDRPNAITFDTTTSGCVITECEPGYHVRTGGAYCDSVPEGPGCGHTCEYADDGRCDDGGWGSAWSDCELGSDCGDCGLRCVEGQITEPGSGQCVTCANAQEPNHAYNACIPCERHNATQFADAPGCEITQCDPQYELHIRTGGQYCDPIQEGPGCGHTCAHLDDGLCDDGGPGSDYSDCEYGSDCRDCGERETLDCSSKTEFHHNRTAAWCEPCQRDNVGDFADVAGSCVISACVEGYHHNVNSSSCDMYKEGHGCNNDCRYSRDGYCDDGYSCPLGTDCEDCGLQCGHAHEEHENACVACERPGAEHFDEEIDGDPPYFRPL